MSTPQPEIEAVILAAGGARRMGGRDKGLLPFEGRPLIEHVIARIQPQCQTLAINCRPEADEAYRGYGLPLLHDETADLGPLGGILCALEQGESEWRLCVPCDTPRLPLDLVERLWAKADSSGAALVSVDDGERRHPSILLLRASLATHLRESLQRDKRKLGRWLDEQGAAYADYSDAPAAFINLNSPDELLQQEHPHE